MESGKENPNVDKIMRINPTNDHEEIIYTKPTAPYATGSGQCHIHVNGFQDCSIDTKDLSVEVTMWDIAGNQIGYVEATKADATNLLSMESKLESFLVITPEHWGDYIQFSLGAESWTSRDNDNASGAYCNTGSWDPRDGPLCNEESLWLGIAERQMDCYFQCPWHGGPPSDGS